MLFTGRVYQISNPTSSKVYVGSTRLTLARRLGLHYRDMRSHARGSHGFVSSFELLGPGATIELLEEDEFDLPLLREREAYWKKTLNTVNRCMPGRGAKESTRVSRAVEVHCQICNKKVKRGHLADHRLTRYCMIAAFNQSRTSSGEQESTSWRSSASSSSLCPSSARAAPSRVH